MELAVLRMRKLMAAVLCAVNELQCVFAAPVSLHFAVRQKLHSTPDGTFNGCLGGCC